MSQTSNDENVVRSYFICLDTEDWQTMRTLWHPDAELRAVGARPRTGVDEVIGYFSRLFTSWPRHTDAPTRFINSGTTYVVEVTFTGTTPDGRAASFDAVDVFDLEGGRIKRLTNWYDIAHVRRLLSEDTPPSA